MARAWAGAGRRTKPEIYDDALSQAAILPEWMQAGCEDDAAADVLEIAEEDAALVGLFLALDTQWRWHPMSAIRTGLDYSAVPTVASMMGVDMSPALFTDLMAMESAAMAEMAVREKARRP